MQNLALALWSLFFKHPVKFQQQQSQQQQAGPRDEDPKTAREWLDEYRKTQEKNIWIPPLTEADLQFHLYLKNRTPSKQITSLLFVKKIWKWENVKPLLIALKPGGFALLQGNKRTYVPFQKGWPEVHKWFIHNEWVQETVMWRDYHIYKKPFPRGGIHLMKSAA